MLLMRRFVHSMDFGLAKWLASGVASPLTQPGTMLGTPGYMPLEQCRGEEVGPTADVYSLGVILFELVVGRPPYTGTALNRITQLAADPVPRVRTY